MGLQNRVLHGAGILALMLGVSASAQAQTVVCYEYDALGRLVAADYGGSTSSALTYAYDPNHNITDTSTATSSAPTCPTPSGDGIDYNAQPVSAVDDVFVQQWDGVTVLNVSADVLANDVTGASGLTITGLDNVLPPGSASNNAGASVSVSVTGIGEHRFDYTVEDANGFIDTATGVVDVVWQPVSAVADTFTYAWDGGDPIVDVVDVLGNDLPLASPKTLVSISEPPEGLTATPWWEDLSQIRIQVTTAGTYPLTYVVEDVDGNTDTGTINIVVDYEPVTASNDSYQFSLGANGAVDEILFVLDNDTPPGSPLTITQVTPGTGSPTVSVGSSSNRVEFSVSATGTYDFTYTVQDENSNTDTATVVVTVDNATVQANPDSYNLTRSTTPQTWDLSVLTNDLPQSNLQIVSVTRTSGVASGSISPDGMHVRITTSNNGESTFNYTIENLYGVQSSSTVSINVTGSGGSGGGGEEP